MPVTVEPPVPVVAEPPVPFVFEPPVPVLPPVAPVWPPVRSAGRPMWVERAVIDVGFVHPAAARQQRQDRSFKNET